MIPAGPLEPQELLGAPKLADQFAAYDAMEQDGLAPYGHSVTDQAGPLDGLALQGADLSAVFAHDDPAAAPARGARERAVRYDVADKTGRYTAEGIIGPDLNALLASHPDPESLVVAVTPDHDCRSAARIIRDSPAAATARDVAAQLANVALPAAMVTVCSACKTEACWQGTLMCGQARTAGTTKIATNSPVLLLPLASRALAGLLAEIDRRAGGA